MDIAKISKALAAAAAAGLSAPGAIAISIPADVSAPWYGYLIAGFLSGVLGFITTYYAPANKPSTS